VAKKKREHEHPDERWLVSYADMITVLMALFIVLFSISVVNKGKFEELAKSLKESFNGAVVDGGDSVLNFGSSNVTAQVNKSAAADPDQPVPDVQQTQRSEAERRAQLEEARAAIERAQALEVKQDESLHLAKNQVDAAVRSLGLTDKVETEINERGLVIRLITDDVLFDIGSATVKPDAAPLLGAVAHAIDPIRNPIRIEGHTDAVPFRGDELGNVELSTGRAMSVFRSMVGGGLDYATHPDLAPSGFGSARPLVPNKPDGSEPRNRRVEIIVLRQPYVEQAERAAQGPLGVNPAGIQQPELQVTDG
jgi:chemotaxis protein MotB